MKKLITTLLVLALLICTFASCGTEKPTEESNSSTTTEQKENQSSEAEINSSANESETENEISLEHKTETTTKETAETTTKKIETTTKKPVETTTKKIETTTNKSVETTTKKTETTTKKPAKKPTLQLNKGYSCRHVFNDYDCSIYELVFHDNIVSINCIVLGFAEYSEYETTKEFHKHGKVKYYNINPDLGAGGASEESYTISGNKITLGNGSVYTIISDNSIKDSSGHIYTITD